MRLEFYTRRGARDTSGREGRESSRESRRARTRPSVARIGGRM